MFCVRVVSAKCPKEKPRRSGAKSIPYSSKSFRKSAPTHCVPLVWVSVFAEERFDTSPDSGPATCTFHWDACTDNSDMANNYRGWSSAHAACKSEANKQIRYGTPK